jgi:hypothetical protein
MPSVRGKPSLSPISDVSVVRARNWSTTFVTPRELAEYQALRDTIRERGTTRVWLQLATFVAWGALAIATAALAALPIATLLPLLVLAGGFETGLAVHTGVERIGRYVQVFFESEADRGWEHRIMAYGDAVRGPASDPLLASYFWIATIFNFVPAILANPAVVEWTVVGAIHLLFMARVGVARRQASRQRAIDLDRFRQLK